MHQPPQPPPEPATRVAIVDDQKLFRGGLAMILSEPADIHVVFEASHGKQLLERIAFEPVDVVILDVEMPVLDGVATLEILRDKYPETVVLMLTMHDAPRLINQLMNAGASGFLLKDENPEVVIEAVRQVAGGGIYFRDYVSRALLQSARGRRQATDAYGARISERELEVLTLICREFTSKEIAEKLFISTRTVEGHRRSLQEKTGSKNLVGLVLYAVRNGIV